MSGEVIEGPWRAMTTYDGTTCDCGEAWFRLWMPDQDPVGAAVVVDREGHITGYRGFLKCMSCGKVKS